MPHFLILNFTFYILNLKINKSVNYFDKLVGKINFISLLLSKTSFVHAIIIVKLLLLIIKLK